MKKYLTILIALVAFALNANAQKGKTPWMIVNMEEVTKHGKNADFDAETATVIFKDKSDRWLDVPGVSGDLSKHTSMKMTVKRANVKLCVNVRYKDDEGQTKQVAAVKFYYQMSSAINKEKVLKFDLLGSSNGKVTEDMLQDVVSLRISMLGVMDGEDEPWEVAFGDFIIE